jgi:hypothetical protein
VSFLQSTDGNGVIEKLLIIALFAFVFAAGVQLIAGTSEEKLVAQSKCLESMGSGCTASSSTNSEGGTPGLGSSGNGATTSRGAGLGGGLVGTVGAGGSSPASAGSGSAGGGANSAAAGNLGGSGQGLALQHAMPTPIPQKHITGVGSTFGRQTRAIASIQVATSDPKDDLNDSNDTEETAKRAREVESSQDAERQTDSKERRAKRSIAFRGGARCQHCIVYVRKLGSNRYRVTAVRTSARSSRKGRSKRPNKKFTRWVKSTRVKSRATLIRGLRKHTGRTPPKSFWRKLNAKG